MADERTPLIKDVPYDGQSVEDGNDPEPTNDTSVQYINSASRSLLSTARENMPHTTSNTQSMMHLMKGMIGTGILAIPSAIRNSGLWVGTVGLMIFGIICVHCMHLLVKCSHGLCNRLSLMSVDYGGVVKYGFETGPPSLRKFAKAAVVSLNVFLCMTQYGFCCVYIVFVGDNIKQVIENYADFTVPVQVYQAFTVLLLLPLAFIRRLKHLAPVSMLANVLCLVGLVILLQFCFRYMKPVSNYPAFNSWATLPLYFGTAVYAFEGIGVVLPVENKMKTPEDFVGLAGVLNTAMVIVTCLYTAVGFFGYLATGGIKGSITLDLPPEALYQSVKIIFSVAIFLTYPLQFFVPHHVIWALLSSHIPNPRAKRICEYIFKICVILITFLAAAVIPHLDLMIALIGALASTAIALIFPALMDIVIFWHEGEMATWELVKDILILIFAFIGFVAGTGTAIYNIIQTF